MADPWNESPRISVRTDRNDLDDARDLARRLAIPYSDVVRYAVRQGLANLRAHLEDGWGPDGLADAVSKLGALGREVTGAT